MMDEGARAWLFKTARKNFWRVSSFYELDDLIQEGHEVYYYVIRHYPNVTEPKHIMSLFKLALMSRITDLANKRTRSVQEVYAEDLKVEPEAESFFSQVLAERDISEAMINFARAPKCVLDALALFMTPEGQARLQLASEAKRPRVRGSRRAARRETLNERLCRLTGYDPSEVDIVESIRTCLEG